MPTILKLGGSIITDKDRPETLDGDSLDALADAVADAWHDGTVEDLVLVHGAGSFGHHHADAHDTSTTAGSHDVTAVSDIHGSMKTLNQFVLARLHERDVPAVPVHPFSAAHRDEKGALYQPSGQVATQVREGFVPVTHGDVVAHAGKGVTILSGDELVVSLAEQLDADRVGLCSTVPGVLDADDEVIPTIREFDDVAEVLGGSESTDVTGGMAGKVRTLLELDVPASIFGRDEVTAFLAGERPGTTVE